MKIELTPLRPAMKEQVRQFVRSRWGAEKIVSRGQVHQAGLLPGFAYVRRGEICGLVTYRIEGRECEIVTLDSLHRGRGVGTALVHQVVAAAQARGCRRIWLVTTNDNLLALGFYQKRGFDLAALHRNAVDRSRELKPEIPLTGLGGIPVRHELELELLL